MRNLIYAINMSLDGCCDHTKFGGDWNDDGDSDEIHDYHADLIREADLIVYGRKTYQLMVPFWPDAAKDQSMSSKAENDFALAFDSVKRVVFSKTLRSAAENTRLVRANLKDEILKLKRESGKSILTGGVSIPSQLMELGLVDEYHIVIFPSVVGEGRRPFEGVSLDKNLKLVGLKRFKAGTVALHYSKK